MHHKILKKECLCQLLYLYSKIDSGKETLLSKDEKITLNAIYKAGSNAFPVLNSDKIRLQHIDKKDLEIPTDSIAANPLDHRSDSKLLHYNLKKSSYTDQKFSKLLNILKKGDLLIMNNTRVIPARINLNKDSGGRIEILFNRKINQDSIEVIFFSSRKPIIGL